MIVQLEKLVACHRDRRGRRIAIEFFPAAHYAG
jgi:hypothetical protein